MEAAKDMNRSLRHEIGRAIDDSQRRVDELKRIAVSLDTVASPNAPTGKSKEILNRYGFCVLGIDDVSTLAHVLRIYIDTSEFETSDEEAELIKLLRSVENEITTASLIGV